VEESPVPKEVQVEVPPELEVSVYANFALVSFGEHDFNIDFCQIVPQPSEDDSPKVRVVSRIRFAQSFVGPLLQAISQNAFKREEAIKKVQEEGEQP